MPRPKRAKAKAKQVALAQIKRDADAKVAADKIEQAKLAATAKLAADKLAQAKLDAEAKAASDKAAKNEAAKNKAEEDRLAQAKLEAQSQARRRGESQGSRARNGETGPRGRESQIMAALEKAKIDDEGKQAGGKFKQLFTAKQVKRFSPRARKDLVASLVANQQYFHEAGITTPWRLVHFFTQVGLETGGLRRLDENMNYSKVNPAQSV